jgi:hypothetical protein
MRLFMPDNKKRSTLFGRRTSGRLAAIEAPRQI